MTLGPWEIIFILIVVLVVFGAGRLSEVGGALGKGVREFRKASAQDTRPSLPTPPATPPTGTTTTTTTVEVIENRCPSCATLNPHSQAFCGQCGIRLSQAV